MTHGDTTVESPSLHNESRDTDESVHILGNSLKGVVSVIWRI